MRAVHKFKNDLESQTLGLVLKPQVTGPMLGIPNPFHQLAAAEEERALQAKQRASRCLIIGPRRGPKFKP